jgi:hypothetical protein
MMLATQSINSPSLGACLDDLLASRFLPQCWAGRIIAASQLPDRLQACTQNLAPGSEWRAHGDADQIFFAIARVHAAKPKAQPATALDVYFLDENAAVYCAGVWEHDRRHGWWLDAVLDLSYDCDRGWWFDNLTDPGASIDRRTSGDRRIEPDRRGRRERKALAAPSRSVRPS